MVLAVTNRVGTQFMFWGKGGLFDGTLWLFDGEGGKRTFTVNGTSPGFIRANTSALYFLVLPRVWFLWRRRAGRSRYRATCSFSCHAHRVPSRAGKPRGKEVRPSASAPSSPCALPRKTECRAQSQAGFPGKTPSSLQSVKKKKSKLQGSKLRPMRSCEQKFRGSREIVTGLYLNIIAESSVF